ncbi:MAG: ABC transporter permease, partial [Candidatus Caldatribacteriaceae bacterium]
MQKNSSFRIRDVQIVALLLLLVGLFVLMSFLTRGKLLEAQSLQALAFQLPLLGLLTLAQMGPMISGGIDLSITATAN